ncbi:MULTISPECIES: SDR family oxidoreductase [Bradyrhizobium]|uniref:Bll4299 protein n=3 Tax=Bradyrhizobium diazoefficiens TaxID=1355477 RepID=Q89M94_BRADU|nr:SDR family oxidoreductase [Bradyrhizobium diazoefficiens]MBP1065695.1 nucleoside-diphosphate-sugar epimerase [Bradyrhizobium japonicum]AND89578.1 3-beta hydroxysteroid dehydrogenase [Bradyrhizobium diazoefficiens USDA 110]AWO91228.1 SDR family oxidoreductase [Bradyrhizobium diazoefficiens]PDT61240.1 3-beta hydroxysteroid dehydrogenase [Bradyrhizobium diazoefficiens]QBP23063.1 SDR family oxidoreductase [Bradyrhizobium diazoefficiens]
MRVFVTGATGFVGSAVVRDLIAAGHSVTGLARTDEGAAAVTALGAEVHRGSLEDHTSLRGGAAASDGVLHLAFNHDFSKFADNCELDRRAILALGEELKGSERPLIVTSGVALLAPGRLATEDDAAARHFPRVSEATAEDLRERGVRAGIVRLPPTTHGEGDHGFVPRLIAIAREKGAAAYIGDGMNRWPAAHRVDAARVYRLALEHGTSARRYHAIAEDGVPFKVIAEVIGKRLGVPVVSKSADEAEQHFGWFARFAAIDVPASSAKTRALLGWAPQEKGLIEDLDQPYYFQA